MYRRTDSPSDQTLVKESVCKNAPPNYFRAIAFRIAPSVKSVSGRRAFVSSIEAVVARHRGALRSENVGMSNHNSNEKLEP
jgi:hypothetical protein